MIRGGKPPISVTQEWTWGLSFMQRTVLLTAVRGPDGLPKYGPVKMLLRWYRRCILTSSLCGRVLENPSDPSGGSFMGPSCKASTDTGHPLDWRDEMDKVVGAYLKDLDAIPHHFQLHLMHAFEIVGYKHPDREIREWFRNVYFRLVHDMHLWPEVESDMDRRLGDSREQWLLRADPATVA